jgi:nitroreductase
MDVFGCMKARAEVRKYKKDPVPEDAIEKMLQAAIQAPSAGNLQDWEFVVVRSVEVKRELAIAAFNQTFVAEAPVVIVVCSDLDRVSSRYGERGSSLYSIQDTAAATENLLLAAHDLGLGSCWVGAFNEERVKEVMVLPTHVRPLVIIPVGYPAENPEKPGRLDLKKVVHYERYQAV